MANHTLGQQLQDHTAPEIAPASRAVLYAPLVLCGGFFLATILLAAIGPITWQFEKPVRLYGFLLLCAAALSLGYLRGVRVTPESTRAKSPISASAVVVVGAVAYLALYLPTVHTLTGKWYPDVWTGLTNPGSAYDLKICLAETSSQVWTYLAILAAPLTIPLMPVTLLFFRRLSTSARVLGISCIVLEVATGVAQAVNKNVAEICAYIVLVLVLLGVGAISQRRPRKVVACIVGIFVVVGLFGAYFSSTLSNRVAQDVSDSNAEICVDDSGEKAPVDRSKVDAALTEGAMVGFGTERVDSPVLQVVPSGLRPITINLTSYLTQGYQGLDLAMREDFEPTWGLGFSEFYRHNVLRATGNGDQEEAVLARTYPGQIEDTYEWPYGLRWSTFFVHPASDITFYGVVLLMLLVGFVFGLSWRDTILRKDPLAATVFFHMCILVFYLNANNQLFQAGRLAVGFTVVVIAWVVLRRSASRRASG
nr:hypothetical protein [uncultured Nocardioides sp.]